MGKLISETKYFILKVLSFFICLFCGVKKIIIFESSSDFCDNTRALFDYMIENKLNKKYKMVWFVRNDESLKKYNGLYDNVYFKKLKFTPNLFSKTFWKMMYYFSVAEYAFYSHDYIGGEGNRKQRRVFLTHGAAPLKNTKGLFAMAKHHTDIISPSEFTAYYSAMVYEGAIGRFRLLGYPRNDKLFIYDENINDIIPQGDFKKKIIWMPTFKHINNNPRNDFGAETQEDISLLTDSNMKLINEVLQKNNMLLIIKFHPAQNMDYVKMVNLNNIISVTNDDLSEKDINLYSLMGDCDALITDYSSVYFDYLLCDKPMAFELADKDKYEKGIGLTFDKPLEYMPGDKIYTINDFIQFLDDVSNNKDNYQEQRRDFTKLCHKNIDSNSSKRIFEFCGFDKIGYEEGKL